jgi:formylglycine-generating enzyme required for sulfatase activity
MTAWEEVATSEPMSEDRAEVTLRHGESIVNTLGMQLVLIKAGEFDMGSPDSDPAAQPNEKPRHRVRITHPFLLGAREVTVGQFRAFVEDAKHVTEGEKTGKGSFGLDLRTGRVEPKPEYTWKHWLAEDDQHPSNFQQTDGHPVVCVSWNDARAFCAWLGKQEGAEYRLPTEAEWEYACRAGTTTRYPHGDDEDGLEKLANIADKSLQEKWVMEIGGQPMHLPPYAKWWDDGAPFTRPVGQLGANPWGLHDMHGNVGEWCSDWYAADYYQSSPVDNPQGPINADWVDVSKVLPNGGKVRLHVVRGGVWLDPATGCRSADRSTQLRHPVHSAADIGFRVVRTC